MLVFQLAQEILELICIAILWNGVPCESVMLEGVNLEVQACAD